MISKTIGEKAIRSYFFCNEKIGQLYMVQVFSNQDQAKKKSILKLIDTNHIGGVIYSNGGPVRQASLNNELQAASRIPLLVGMDAEWGLSMRLDSTYAFPWNMTLGAVKNLDLIRQSKLSFHTEFLCWFLNRYSKFNSSIFRP